MNKVKCSISLCIILLCAALFIKVHAQGLQSSSSNPPRKYDLELIYVADAAAPEYLRVIKLQGDKSFPHMGYKSLYAARLRDWIKQYVPDGSTIEWAPGCMRTGGEPNGKEIEDFQKFCETEGVKFIVHPSG